MAKKKKNDVASIGELIQSPSIPNGKKKRGKSKATPKEQAQGCLLLIAIVVVIATVVSQNKDNKPTTTNPTQSSQVASRATNTPRASITPIIREKITAEALASMVARAMATPTPTDGVAGTATNTMLRVTDSPTNTDMPTNTPAPTPLPTQSGVREIADEGVVTGQSVRVRSCASTECAELGRLFNGTTFPITGSVGDGQSIEGNRLWYQITYNGQGGYVSATLVGLVSAQPVVPVGQNISPVQPTQPIVAPVSGWNCSGDRYNCPDFGSGGQFTCPQLFEYMSACPSDPSKLDRDRDGRFCETQCG